MPSVMRCRPIRIVINVIVPQTVKESVRKYAALFPAIINAFRSFLKVIAVPSNIDAVSSSTVFIILQSFDWFFLFSLEKDIIRSTFSKDLLQNDPPQARTMEQNKTTDTIQKRVSDDSTTLYENYPNINRVVRLLSTFISQVHRKPQQRKDVSNSSQDIQLKREMRSDVKDGEFGARISPNTFSSGWRALPKNVNKFRSNSNWLLRHTTEKPTTTPAQTKASVIPSTTTVVSVEQQNSQQPNLVNSSTSEPSSSPSILTNTVNTTSSTQNKSKPGDFSTTQCLVNGKEYSNGQILPKSATNPCNYCRCFYGKEICQEQQCPSPPSSNCVSERVEGQCCPTFTCRSPDSEPTNNTSRSQIRHGPQYEPDADNDASKKQQTIDMEVRASEPVKVAHPLIPPSPPSQPHRLSFPVDALPRPIEQLLFMGSRIHFPNGGNSLPSLRLPPNLPPQLIINSHKKGAIRPHFRPGQMVPIHVLPVQHQFPKNVNDSPIRTLPQSPMMVPTNAKQPEPDVDALSTEDSLPKQPDQDPELTKVHEVSTSTIAPTTTEKSLWDIFKISGCNIYGKVYRAGEKIDKLSGKCKLCICSSQGVQCNQTC